MDINAMRHRLRVELRDLIELVLVPGLAAILPWRWTFYCFSRISHSEWLYRVAAQANCNNAEAHDMVSDPVEWRRKWRLVTLIDHADFYLARTRSDRWMQRHMDVTGTWPEANRPALTLTFHWGAGMWALRHLAASGLNVHALFVAPKRASYPGRWIQYHYLRLRFNTARNALGYPPLDISANMRPVLQAFKANHQVGGAIDVPPFMVASSQVIPFLGGHAKFPRGLLRVASERGIPVAIFVNGIDLLNGRRFLRIHTLGVEKDLDTLMEKAFLHLESVLQEESAGWHFWGMSKAFFE